MRALENEETLRLAYRPVVAPDSEPSPFAEAAFVPDVALAADDPLRLRMEVMPQAVETALKEEEFYVEARFSLPGSNTFVIDPAEPGLSERERERIADYAAFLFERPDYAVLVEGYSARGNEDAERVLNGLVAASRVQLAIEKAVVGTQDESLPPGQVATLSCGARRPEMLAADPGHDRVRVSVLPPGFADPRNICGWLDADDWSGADIATSIEVPSPEDSVGSLQTSFPYAGRR